MKNIFKHFAPFNIFKFLKNLDKETWRELGENIFIILSPLIFTTIIFNIIILLGSFLLWHLPNSMYFPFLTGGTFQVVFDRFAIIIGFILLFEKFNN